MAGLTVGELVDILMDVDVDTPVGIQVSELDGLHVYAADYLLGWETTGVFVIATGDGDLHG